MNAKREIDRTTEENETLMVEDVMSLEAQAAALDSLLADAGYVEGTLVERVGKLLASLEEALARSSVVLVLWACLALGGCGGEMPLGELEYIPPPTKTSTSVFIPGGEPKPKCSISCHIPGGSEDVEWPTDHP